MNLNIFRGKKSDDDKRKESWKNFDGGEIEGKYILDKKGLIVQFEGDESEYSTCKISNSSHGTSTYNNVYSFNNPNCPLITVLLIVTTLNNFQRKFTEYYYNCFLCNRKEKSINFTDMFTSSGTVPNSVVGRVGDQICFVGSERKYYDMSQNMFRDINDKAILTFTDIGHYQKLDFKIKDSANTYFPRTLPFDKKFIGDFINKLNAIDSQLGIGEKDSLKDCFLKSMNKQLEVDDELVFDETPPLHVGDFIVKVSNILKNLENRQYAQEIRTLVNNSFLDTHFRIDENFNFVS